MTVITRGASVIGKWDNLRLHSCANGMLWGSLGYAVVCSDDAGASWNHVATLAPSGISSLLSLIAPTRRLLRLGVRSYIQIDLNSFVAFCQGQIFYWRRDLPTPILVGKIRHGHGPLLQGCCRDDANTCYYGEYWGNKAREEVHIYHWRPDWDAWRLFYKFPAGNIRHIHAVQFDPFAKKIWVATGDRDSESSIGYFTRSADAPRWVPVTQGSQSARAVSLMFTPDFVYWGSDAGKDTSVSCDWIYRWSRKTGQVQRLAPVGGPVYYSTMDSQGRLFVSTTVEGSPSEPDRFARVWMSEDGLNWQEIASWQQDAYPRRFGYGILSFPHGVASDGQLYVVGQGVQGGPGTWILEV
jgi:hypothetical protein